MKTDFWGGLLDLVNRFPNAAYPGGEAAYDQMVAEYEAKYGSADDLRAWKNVVWRELWHFIGGAILGILNLPVIFLAPMGYAFIIPEIIFLCLITKEIELDGLHDRGYLMPKDFLDAFMWGLGAHAWLLLLLVK